MHRTHHSASFHVYSKMTLGIWNIARVVRQKKKKIELMTIFTYQCTRGNKMSSTYVLTYTCLEILSATARPVCVFRLSSVTGKMGECVRVVTSSLFFSELWLYTDSGKLARFMCTNVCLCVYVPSCQCACLLVYICVYTYLGVVLILCLFVYGCGANCMYIIIYTQCRKID